MLGVGPEVFLGQPRSCEGYEIEITQEMIDAVQIYLDVIDGAGDVVLESRIEHSTIPGFGGTIDCTAITKGRIIDLKYGSGLVVEAENNVQLGCYALLYQDHFDREGDVEITTVQPRASHPDGPVRTWIAPAEWLADLKEKIEQIALYGPEDIHAGDHCRWCPGKVECPELYELTVKTASADFEDDGMTNEKASEILALKSALKGYMDSIEKWVHSRLDKGECVPGFKLVETFGNRRYAVGEDEVVRKCRSRKFGKKQIYESKLLSPAQLEKIVGKELTASLVERPRTGTTVAPESDRRKAVERSTPSIEFEDCESL
jgi:hypothetical protein